jgi:hypothetical protein
MYHLLSIILDIIKYCSYIVEMYLNQHNKKVWFVNSLFIGHGFNDITLVPEVSKSDVNLNLIKLSDLSHQYRVSVIQRGIKMSF